MPLMMKRWTTPPRAVVTAVFSLGCNAVYGVYQGIVGICSRSLWFVVLWAFYWILAALRFCVLMCARIEEKDEREEEKAAIQAFVTRAAGVLLLLLACVLMWSVVIHREGEGKVHGEITMIAIATYTFYKITGTLVQVCRKRKHQPIFGKVLQKVGIAEGAASLLTLQRSMLATFGRTDFLSTDQMNRWIGGGICLLIVVLGMTMAVKERRT